jgi:hypothetical protein
MNQGPFFRVSTPYQVSVTSGAATVNTKKCCTPAYQRTRLYTQYTPIVSAAIRKATGPLVSTPIPTIKPPTNRYTHGLRVSAMPVKPSFFQ